MIRLEAEEKMDKRLLGILKEEFEIKDTDIYNIPGPLDLTMLMKGLRNGGALMNTRVRNIHRLRFRNFRMIKIFSR